jgi:hypothetical protein
MWCDESFRPSVSKVSLAIQFGCGSSGMPQFRSLKSIQSLLRLEDGHTERRFEETMGSIHRGHGRWGEAKAEVSHIVGKRGIV